MAPCMTRGLPAAVLIATSIFAASCTRYVDAAPVAAQDPGVGLAIGAGDTACTSVEAPLTDIDPLDEGEPVLRIPQPQGWKRYTDMDDDLFRFTMSNVDLVTDDFAPTVVVTLESKAGIVDPAVVFEQQLQSLEKGFGATEVTATKVVHCGLPAERIEYITPPIEPVGALPAQVLITVMQTEDRTYAATVTTQTDNPRDKTYQQDTEEILGGFQMLAPGQG